ncbi:hypothetical protein [Actinoplanes sp. URMC 104]|uniref:hypothetical protein n=1 Tax=Actinoplanes sp. URMC 104 TaxID=3423409 RepID=UPI003F19CB0D
MYGGVDPASFDFTLDVQVNVEASAEELPRVVHDWLDRGFTVLAGEIKAGTARLPELAAAAGRVVGAGDSFGQIRVDRGEGRARRAAARAVSEAGWRWLRDELSEMPRKVTVDAGRLDATGLIGGENFTARASVHPESPGWVQLHASVRRSRFLDAEHGLAAQQRCREFLEDFADRRNPGYGQITYYYYGGRTPVEELVDPRVAGHRPSDPALTIGTCREVLRGYGWLTIVPQELVDRLGGVAALTASGAFAQVRPLARGGVSLLVTDDFRDYTVQSVEAAFKVLAPVLPPGRPLPLQHRSPVEAPVIIVAADPAGAL